MWLVQRDGIFFPKVTDVAPSLRRKQINSLQLGTLRLRLGQLSVIPALRLIDFACRLLCLYGWRWIEL